MIKRLTILIHETVYNHSMVHISLIRRNVFNIAMVSCGTDKSHYNIFSENPTLVDDNTSAYKMTPLR